MSVDFDRINDTLNSVYHCLVFYDDPPANILAALQQKLPEMQRKDLEAALDWGSVYVNGKKVDNNINLVAPLKLEYYQPKVPYGELSAIYPKFNQDWILYQDKHLAICYKPVGLSSARAKEQQKYSIYDYLCDYHQVDVHLPSRLDFSTSGLILYSINPESHGVVQKLFSNREIDKKYLLKVSQKVDWSEKVVKANIGHDRRHPVLRKIKEEGGRSAETRFTNMSEEFAEGVLEARPITGRTHQIRVHAALALGLPIVGDNFYSGEPANELHLLSYSLEFKHPITQEILTIECPQQLLPLWLGK